MKGRVNLKVGKFRKYAETCGSPRSWLPGNPRMVYKRRLPAFESALALALRECQRFSTLGLALSPREC